MNTNEFREALNGIIIFITMVTAWAIVMTAFGAYWYGRSKRDE